MPIVCRYTVHTMARASLKTVPVAFAIVLVAALSAPLLAHGAIGKPRIAALQAALWDRGHYQSTIDGLRGPLTRGAIRDFQREHGLRVTGRAGAPTVAALGGPARRLQGVAALRKGARGWDVVRLQFLLAWHGFPSGPFDGEFGQRVERADPAFPALGSARARRCRRPWHVQGLCEGRPRDLEHGSRHRSRGRPATGSARGRTGFTQASTYPQTPARRLLP